jgi:hypothetical protein
VSAQRQLDLDQILVDAQAALCNLVHLRPECLNLSEVRKDWPSKQRHCPAKRSCCAEKIPRFRRNAAGLSVLTELQQIDLLLPRGQQVAPRPTEEPLTRHLLGAVRFE